MRSINSYLSNLCLFKDLRTCNSIITYKIEISKCTYFNCNGAKSFITEFFYFSCRNFWNIQIRIPSKIVREDNFYRYISHWLYQSFYARKMRALYWNHFWYQIGNRHLWQLKKSKSWGPFWSYQLNSTANPAHLPQNWAKWAELAVLFSW